MKAVFLDKGTFLDNVDLPAPDGVTEYLTYDDTKQNNQEIIERCQNVEIVITNKVKIDRQVIESLPSLKLIQLTATGMNNVDKQACEDNNITLYNVAGYAIKSVPEHTFMLMLNAMRAGLYYHNKVVDGSWSKSGSFCLMDIPLVDLENKTLGIIGAGTIGKRVSEIAKAFGMTVLWAEHQGKAPRNADYTDFDTVLNTANVITLHCPLNENTKHLINTLNIQKMHKKPLIVNVARGGIVDSQAMADALHNKKLLGYASDVFEHEPIQADDPLINLAKQNHPRVIFSPHNAWGSYAAQQKLWEILSEQVSGYITNNCK